MDYQIAASSLNPSEITTLFLSLAVLLVTARALGELARRFQQPAVLGEILAGIILGKTVLGTILPGLSAFLFPAEGSVALSLNAFSTVAIALFLLVAGLEVDLGSVWRQGRPALAVGALGMIIPFAGGFLLAKMAPQMLGLHGQDNPLVAELFLGTALSISALPVIAKILLDLKLYRSDMGMVVIAAGILNDLVGWLIFALLLGMMGQHDAAHFSVGATAGLTLLFGLLMLTVGRWLINQMLPWVQAHLSWPGGMLGVLLTLALLCAAFTEWIGIHAIFGTFIFGVAAGDSRHLREQTRATLDQFISFFFAPLFFASFGLQVNFIANFDWMLVSVILIVAVAGKLVGCALGARWSGLGGRESLAIGFGMNARGAMEIILGILALQAGLIGERLFVGLVLMALVTSFMSGSLMQWVLGAKKVVHFATYLTPGRFVHRLKSRTKQEIVQELVQVLGDGVPIEPQRVVSRVWYHEQQVSSGLGNAVAAPHARIPDLKSPLVAVGLLDEPVDFDQADGAKVQVVCLVLTNFEEPQMQPDLLASIRQTFSNPGITAQAVAADNYVQFLAVVKSIGAEPDHSAAPAPA